MRLQHAIIFAAAVAMQFAIGCSDRELKAEEEIVTLRAQDALEAWQTGAWTEMYAVLSTKDKSAMSEAEFIEKREKLAESRSLDSFSIDEITRTADDGYLVKITLNIDEDYNARIDSALENKIATVSTEWKFVQDQGTLALTFLNH